MASHRNLDPEATTRACADPEGTARELPEPTTPSGDLTFPLAEPPWAIFPRPFLLAICAVKQKLSPGDRPDLTRPEDPAKPPQAIDSPVRSPRHIRDLGAPPPRARSSGRVSSDRREPAPTLPYDVASLAECSKPEPVERVDATSPRRFTTATGAPARPPLATTASIPCQTAQSALAQKPAR